MDEPDLRLTLDELMRRWPGTISVFVRHRMACVGCMMAPFMTVADAAREYGLDAASLGRELTEAASSTGRDEP
jgi:hybrid cluster-associated redox disulfide protein